jgi:ribosome-associated toxin RatA of RatAB toxin-antitoxin module
MQTVIFEAIVPLACSEAFNLSTDLPGYKDFLPMLRAVEVSDRQADGATVRFDFDLGDSKLGSLAKKLGVKTEQTARLRWKTGREITGEGLPKSGPLKSILMQGWMEPDGEDKTKIRVEVQFETGYIWPADTIARHYIKSQGDRLVRNIDAEIAEFKARRALKP